MQRTRFASRQASERLRGFRGDDRGIILILTALIFPVLLAFEVSSLVLTCKSPRI